MKSMKYVRQGTVVLFAVMSLSVYAGEEEHEYKGYVAVRGGVSLLEDTSAFDAEFDTGWLLGAAVGAKTKQQAWMGGVEVEIMSQGNNIKDTQGTLLQDSVMFNGFVGARIGSVVTPYILAGAGGVFMLYDSPLGDETDSVFAYQLGLGIDFSLGEKMELDLGYRFYNADAAFEGVNVKGDRFFVGFSYAF